MEDGFSIGQLIQVGSIVTVGGILAFSFFLLAKNKLSSSRFLRFLGILGLTVISSCIPFGPFGLIFGMPSAVIASILISLFLDSDKEKV